METTTIERINELSAERARLYQKASNGRRGEPDVLLRIRAIGQELETLWESRRAERVGVRDGIDLIVDLSYERAYGQGYEDAVAPPQVEEAEREMAVAAA